MRTLVGTPILKSFGEEVTAKSPYFKCLNVKRAVQRPTFHGYLREGTSKLLCFRGDRGATANSLRSGNQGDMVRMVYTIQRGRPLSRAAPLIGVCPSRGTPRPGAPRCQAAPQWEGDFCLG